MVADAGATFGSAIAPELETVIGFDCLEVFRFFAGVLYQFAVIIAGNAVNILMVYEVALYNGTVGFANQFSVLENLFALSKVLQGYLVAIGNVLFGADGEQLAALLVDNVLSFCDLRDTSHDIIGLIHHQCVNFHACPPIEFC
jgi:hypothetical protein